MKTIPFKKILFLFVICLYTVSCSDDSSSEEEIQTPVITANLAGAWTASAVEYTGTSSIVIEGNKIISEFEGIGYNVDFTLTFNEQPAIVSTEGAYSIELTTTLLGQSNVQEIENLSFANIGSWSQDGDQLTVTNNAETITATITELTESKLVINFKDEQDVLVEGFTTTVVTDSYFTFVR